MIKNVTENEFLIFCWWLQDTLLYFCALIYSNFKESNQSDMYGRKQNILSEKPLSRRSRETKRKIRRLYCNPYNTRKNFNAAVEDYNKVLHLENNNTPPWYFFCFIWMKHLSRTWIYTYEMRMWLSHFYRFKAETDLQEPRFSKIKNLQRLLICLRFIIIFLTFLLSRPFPVLS